MGKKFAVEFMKIRRYVLNLIATGGDMPQRVPSSRKLGEMFGVTHPTALRAIQALTEDGYLQPLRGGGSITCPANCNLKNTRLFGFLEGDGKIAIDIYYTVCLYSIAARELTRRNLTYCCQHLYLNSPADLESMIQENHLAGLVALNIRLPELKAEVCRKVCCRRSVTEVMKLCFLRVRADGRSPEGGVASTRTQRFSSGR